MPIRKLLALSKYAKPAVPRETFVEAVQNYLESNGWLKLSLGQADGDRHEDISRRFLHRTEKLFESHSEVPLVRAMTRGELVDIFSTGFMGINKQHPQIRGMKDHIDPAEHLIENNSANFMATAHSTQEHHAIHYAMEYAKLHGVKASFLAVTGLPLVYLKQSVASVLYPAHYTYMDRQQELKQEMNGFTKVPESSLKDAQKSEISVITGVPRTDVNWRPTDRDIAGVLSANTARKVATFFTNEPATRLVQAAFLNDDFAPYSFSLEVVGSEIAAPDKLDVATENAHKQQLLPQGQRPVVVEDVIAAVPLLTKEFPRLEGRLPLNVPAATQIFSALPAGIARRDIPEFLVEAHRPHYAAQRQAIAEAREATKACPVFREIPGGNAFL